MNNPHDEQVLKEFFKFLKPYEVERYTDGSAPTIKIHRDEVEGFLLQALQTQRKEIRDEIEFTKLAWIKTPKETGVQEILAQGKINLIDEILSSDLLKD